MHMRMVLEVLAPSVQHSGDADVGAKVLGIAGNGGERLGCGREQQSVELGLVLVGDRSVLRLSNSPACERFLTERPGRNSVRLVRQLRAFDHEPRTCSLRL